MMLRLVLVGIVAGLGVTVPSRPVGLGWLGSAERWANETLADWDTWKPTDAGDARRRAAVSVHECEQCRLARAAIRLRERKLAAAEVGRSTRWAPLKPAVHEEKSAGQRQPTPAPSATTAPTVAFLPLEVNDDDYSSIAYELNRQAEGIDLVRPGAPDLAQTPEARALAVTATFDFDLPDVLCGATDEDLAALALEVEASAVQTGNTSTVCNGVASTATGDDTDGADTTAAGIIQQVGSRSVTPRTEGAASAQVSDWNELVACDQAFSEMSGALAVKEGLDITDWEFQSTVEPAVQTSAAASPSRHGIEPPAVPAPPTPAAIVAAAVSPVRAKTEVELPWPAFAPQELVAQSPTNMVQATTFPWPVFAPAEPSITRDLPAITMRLHESPPSTRRADAPSSGTPASVSEGRVGHAVDLTRQAMRAWLGVLIRSEAVTMTAR